MGALDSVPRFLESGDCGASESGWGLCQSPGFCELAQHPTPSRVAHVFPGFLRCTGYLWGTCGTIPRFWVCVYSPHGRAQIGIPMAQMPHTYSETHTMTSSSHVLDAAHGI